MCLVWVGTKICRTQALQDWSWRALTYGVDRDEHFCKLAFVSQCNQPVCLEYFAEMHLTFLLFQECQDHTVGDFCEQCEDIYLPVSLPDGTFVCRPCACPLSFESNKWVDLRVVTLTITWKKTKNKADVFGFCYSALIITCINKIIKLFLLLVLLLVWLHLVYILSMHNNMFGCSPETSKWEGLMPQVGGNLPAVNLHAVIERHGK